MSFILFAVATAAAAATASYLALRRGKDAEREEGSEPPPAADGDEEVAPVPGLAFQLRDVVQVQGEERWLAGALVAREGAHVIAVLYFAPEGKRTDAVLAFPEPRRELYWLTPVEGIVHGADPPTTVELEKVIYRRKSRRPVDLEARGQGVPRVGASAILAEYEGGGRSVALVLRAEDGAWTFVGSRHEAGEYDVLGGGGED